MLALRTSALRVCAPIVLCASVSTLAGASGLLPDRSVPTGLTAKDEPGGGRIVSGLVPNAASSIDATRVAIGEMRGYFDHRPNVRGAVASPDKRSSIVLFDAALRGVAVRGLIVATAQTGAAEVAFLFDDPKHLERSLGAMENDLSARNAASLRSAPVTPSHASVGGPFGDWNAAASHAAAVSLRRQTFSDNSGSVGLAPAYELRNAAVGSFTATGADGSLVREGQSLTAIDPSAGHSDLLNLPLLAYSDDVASTWLALRRAAQVKQGTPDDGLTIEQRSEISVVAGDRRQMVAGRAHGPSGPMLYLAFLTLTPPTRGFYTIGWSILWSPADRLTQAGPKLVAMLHSYRSDQGVIDAEFQNFSDRNAAREQAFARSSVASNEASRIRLERLSAQSLQQSADAQDWIRREGASTIHMLRNDDPVFAADGAHVTVPLGTSLGYGSVPISQYIEGVDY